MRLLAWLVLLASLQSCALVASAWDAVFGEGEEEAAAEEVDPRDPALVHSLRDEDGGFDPSMVLEEDDQPLLREEQVSPQRGSSVAEASASRDAGGSGATRPANGGDEATDDEKKVARARNPAEAKPPPDEGQGAETLDLVLEIAALGLLSALLALFLRASFHHPGAVNLGVGLVALLLAALALVRVS